MNYTQATATSGDTCYLSPRGHYYVAKGEIDPQFVRHAQLMQRYQPKQGAPSQFELAKRASR